MVLHCCTDWEHIGSYPSVPGQHLYIHQYITILIIHREDRFWRMPQIFGWLRCWDMEHVTLLSLIKRGRWDYNRISTHLALSWGAASQDTQHMEVKEMSHFMCYWCPFYSITYQNEHTITNQYVYIHKIINTLYSIYTSLIIHIWLHTWCIFFDLS